MPVLQQKPLAAAHLTLGGQQLSIDISKLVFFNRLDKRICVDLVLIDISRDIRSRRGRHVGLGIDRRSAKSHDLHRPSMADFEPV